jgi:hypothetical protein
MGVVKIGDLRIKEWKRQQISIEITPIFSSQLSFHCVPTELKNVLHTNCIALNMTPNMANNTQ